MKKPKISIIVPVYNVEKYIEKCLKSLINQTYDNIEIIVVNDCSTDDSEKVIKKVIQNKKNIKYIKNKVNSGLSFTRNVALDNCTGDFISYIDSDDYIPLDFYEKMVNVINKEKSDIVICDINIVYENEKTEQRTYCGGKDNIDFIDNGLAASACNKIFKKEIMQRNKFSVGKVNEDLAVVLPAIINAKKVSYCEDTVYNYIQRDNSIQNSSFSEKRFDIFYGVKLTLDRIKNIKNYEEYKQLIVFHQIIMLFIYVIPKEPSFFKRVKWLRRFNKLSKNYDIRNNKNLWQFLENQPKKSKYYYKLLFKLNCDGFSFLSSLLISMFNIYRKNFRKNIIKQNITINDLINLSEKQKRMKNNNVSISVVVPNYNYEKFLYQRLYSILYQKVKIDEIIILDDCSKDNSRQLINNIYDNLKDIINIRKVYNKENSGSAFKQWKKGFELAKGDYVWIAEADDYCDKNLLNELIKPIKDNKDIYISYADTAFINAEGKIILKSIVPEIDIMKTGHWNENFIDDGKEEYKNYSFLNCTLANVSSCIIKKDNYEEEFKLSGNYKQAGDWLLYVNIMRKGKIAYCNKPLNYYRMHGNNVSSTFKKEAHLNEIKKIHEYYRNNYGLNKFQEAEIEKRYKFLKEVWKLGD